MANREIVTLASLTALSLISVALLLLSPPVAGIDGGGEATRAPAAQQQLVSSAVAQPQVADAAARRPAQSPKESRAGPAQARGPR